MKKKILLALGIPMAVLLVIILLILGITSGITQIAEDFFVMLDAGNTHEAYDAYLSEGFRQNTSFEKFEAFINQTGLSDFKDAQWQSRSIYNNQGELEGEFHNRSGQSIPLKIMLIKENEEWKILSIKHLQGGILSNQNEPDIPDDSTLERMASEAVHSLGNAINKEDFTEFHEGVSMIWKTQTNPEELRTAFEEFIIQNIDLTSIQGTEAVFNKPPHVDEDGLLKLDGYFATQSANVLFGLSYVYEHPDWKLVGINVRTNQLQ